MSLPEWSEWCRERVAEAREHRAILGPTLELTMLRMRHHYVYEIMEKFPDMDLRVALHEMVWFAIQADHHS